MCVRERERERVSEPEGQRERERERVSLSVCKRERESEPEGQRERERTMDFYRSKKKKKKKDGEGEGRVVPKKKSGRSSEGNYVLSQWTNRLSPEWLQEHGRPRKYTVSVALPGSILRKVQTLELKTALVGQIARILALYEVDEVVVFIDSGYEQAGDPEKGPSVLMSRLLQYVEAPPYLRKKLFPVHRDLKFTGLMQSVDAPHHMMHKEDRSLYREGIVTDKPAGEGKCWVDIGTHDDVRIDHQLRQGIRVTVKLTEHKGKNHTASYEGEAVSPSEPREEYGIYWGYQTRLVRSFSEIFTGCPFATSSDGTYDFTIGHTTNRGLTAKMTNEGSVLQPLDRPNYTFSHDSGDDKHYLLVFGGAQGLEGCVEADESLSTVAANTDTLFDVYWNALPSNGARAVRTEEELIVSLSKITGIIKRGLAESSDGERGGDSSNNNNRGTGKKRKL